jgi:hypothetical protein
MRRKSRVHVCPTLLTCLALVGLSTIALAQSGPGCPEVLSSLMPGNAVKVTCQYNAAGILGMGFATAALPFKNICANQVTPNPGKISYDLKHYGSEAIEMFKMQIGPEEQQRTQSKLAEFEKKYKKMNAAKNPQLVSLSPLKTEAVSGGSISYFGFETDCSEGEKRSKPTVYLHAVGHSDSTAINIEVSGNISVGAAKAAASEVLKNFTKANFSTLDK